VIDDLLTGLSGVWTPAAVLAALAGGIVVGLIAEGTSPPRAWRLLLTSALLVGTIGVTVFWSGQIADALLQADQPWGRVVARALLQELFVLAAAVAAALLRWHHHADP
jgi:hypothetical protein